MRLLVIAASMGIAACGERLESGAACPILCSGESLTLRDTVIDGVAFDTTFTGFPPRGSSSLLMLANSGDTVEVRYVVRFDSVPSKYVKDGATDSLPITDIDSAYVRVSFDETASRFSGPVTFEAYDVNSATEDSLTSALLPLFAPDRLLGTVTVDSASLKDSVRIYLNDDVIRSKVVNNTRIRLGIRVRSATPVRLAVFSANGAEFARLGFKPAPGDATVGNRVNPPRSGTPADQPRIAIDFTDYTIAAGAGALPADAIGVGGPRGRRTYLRFDIPARITDSTTIVRATLILNQRPAPSYGFADSILVSSHVVVATTAVTDLAKAAFLTDTVPGRLPPRNYSLTSIRIPPAGEGERRIDIASVVRDWNSVSTQRLPPAIVLRSATEATSILEARFYSTEAGPTLRPRLLLTYVPRAEFGIP